MASLTLGGMQYVNLSATVGTSSTAVLNAGVATGSNSQHNGKVVIANPSKTANFWLALAGETAVAGQGLPLAPLTAVTFDKGECPQNVINAICDTASTNLTIYAIGG